MLFKHDLIHAINNGNITLHEFEWYTKQNYVIVCDSGKAVDIVKEN